MTRQASTEATGRIQCGAFFNGQSQSDLLICRKTASSDIGSFLTQYERSSAISLDIREFDIERSSQQDLTKDELWEEIFATLKEEWILIVSPPCANTLKSRYKTWKSFRNWLDQHRGRVYPLGTKDALYRQLAVSCQ